MTRGSWSTAVALVVTCILAGCGGPPPAVGRLADPTTPPGSAAPAPQVTPPTTGGNEACGLVRAADLEELLGVAPEPEPLAAGVFAVIVDATSAECRWQTAEGLQLTVRTVRVAEGRTLANDIDSVWKAFTDYELEIGVGDEARVHMDAGAAAHVVAVRGDAAVYASYETGSADADAKRDALIALVSDTLASMAR